MDIEFRTLDDIEEGMIDNMEDSEIDAWVKIDDGICKGLKSDRSNVVVVSKDSDSFWYNFNLFGSEVSEFTKTIKATKNYTIYEYDGVKFATDRTAQSIYFANEDDMYKVSELCKKNTPDYFAEDDSEEDKFPMDDEEDELEILNEYGYDDSENWKMLDHKSVQDYDGFYTDYTLYMRVSDESPKYVCVFGDRDLYTPSDNDFDFETDSESEAYEWFEDYNGFADELNEAINSGSIVNAPAKHKRLDKELEKSTDNVTSSQYATAIVDMLDSDTMDWENGVYDKTEMAFENMGELSVFDSVDEDTFEDFYNDFDLLAKFVSKLSVSDAKKVFLAVGKAFDVSSYDEYEGYWGDFESDFEDSEADITLDSLDDSEYFTRFGDTTYTPLEIGKRVIMKNGDILYITDIDEFDNKFIWASSNRRDIESGKGHSYLLRDVVYVEE